MPQIADTLAWCYFREGNAAVAEPLTAEAARALPENSVVRFHRGMVLTTLGRSAEAAAELRAAVGGGLPKPEADEAAAALESLGKP
jgi:Flp pilus assembly protein TadD